MLFSFGDESVSVVFILDLDGYRVEAFFCGRFGFQSYWRAFQDSSGWVVS